MAELADALDSGSSVLNGRGGSTPLRPTLIEQHQTLFRHFPGASPQARILPPICDGVGIVRDVKGPEVTLARHHLRFLWRHADVSKSRETGLSKAVSGGVTKTLKVLQQGKLRPAGISITASPGLSTALMVLPNRNDSLITSEDSPPCRLGNPVV